MIKITSLSAQATNGHLIGYTLYEPEKKPVAKVLIAPALGTEQRYYTNFASWLAEHGYLVATFDYSGTGKSRVEDIRSLDVDLLDWAKHDCLAMLRTLSDTSSPVPLYWLGHSLGGQLLGLTPETDRVYKAITIASGGGYWLDGPFALKFKVWWLWYVVAPLSIKLFGYFPGRKLRKVGDIPKGVMNQLRRWYLHPQYVIGSEGQAIAASYASVKTHISSISFSDDEIVSQKDVSLLLSMYTNASKSTKCLHPHDVSQKRIGHFGFFSSRCQNALWEAHLLPELS